VLIYCSIKRRLLRVIYNIGYFTNLTLVACRKLVNKMSIDA